MRSCGSRSSRRRRGRSTAWPRRADSEIRFLQPFEAKETVFTEVPASAPTARDYDFRIENRKTGAGVHVTGDRPLAEAAVLVGLEDGLPGAVHRHARSSQARTFTWRITYEFYQAANAGGGSVRRSFFTETRR